MQLFTVDQADVDTVWPRVAPLLSKALEHSDGELGTEQLYKLALTGRVRIVLAMRDDVFVGAAAVEFVRYPNYVVANVIALGGNSLMAGEGEFHLLKQWAKANGAAKLQGYCRESVARLLRRAGLKQTYVVVRCDL